MEEPGGLQSWGRKACRYGHNTPINSRPSIHNLASKLSPTHLLLLEPNPLHPPPPLIREALVTVPLEKPAFAQACFANDKVTFLFSSLFLFLHSNKVQIKMIS